MGTHVATRSAGAGILAVILASCGGPANLAPSSSVSTSASAATSPSAPPPASVAPRPSAPTPSATAAAASVPAVPALFASSVYPYTLQLPAGLLTRNWKVAIRAWDGQARVGTDTPNVDMTGTVDGGLLIWGLPWEGNVTEFGDAISDAMARFHGCKIDGLPEPFAVGPVAGIGQRQHCAQDTQTLTMTLVNDGYGLVFRLRYDPAKAAIPLDHVVGWLDGLTWTGR